MPDAFIGLDEDPIVDKKAATRTVVNGNGDTVHVPGVIVYDHTANRWLSIDTNGAAAVQPRHGATITTTTPTMSGTNRILVAAANPNRLGLIITNWSSVEVWCGDINCDIYRGVPLLPQERLTVDKSPAAAWYVKPIASIGGNFIGILEELM